MPGFDHVKLVILEGNRVGGEFSRNRWLRDLAGEEFAEQVVAVLLAGLAACLRDCSRRRDSGGAGKGLEHLSDAVDVVAVPMGQEDVRQVAAVRANPIDELLVLLDRKEGVD